MTAAGFMLVEAGVFGGFGRHRAMPIGNSRSLTRRTPLLGLRGSAQDLQRAHPDDLSASVVGAALSCHKRSISAFRLSS